MDLATPEPRGRSLLSRLIRSALAIHITLLLALTLSTALAASDGKRLPIFAVIPMGAAAHLLLAPRPGAMAPEILPVESDEGRTRLERSLNRYAALSRYFRAQQTPSTCAIASSCMALRALDPDLNDLSEAEFLRTASSLRKVGSILFTDRGVMLDEIGLWLTAKFPVLAKARHADEADEREFTKTVIHSLKTQDSVVIVNFYGRDMGLDSGGHFSVVGGYDSTTDSVLILDVAKHKFPDYWLPVSSLMNGMRAVDTTAGRSRGFINVMGRAAACKATFTAL